MTVSLIATAKQGNVVALTTLLDDAVSTFGFRARVSLRETVLLILVEGDRVPCVSRTTKFIRKGLSRLSPANIATVKLYGKALTSQAPTWRREWHLPTWKVSRAKAKALLPGATPQDSPEIPLAQSDYASIILPSLTKRSTGSVWPRRLTIGIAATLLIGTVAEMRQQIRHGQDLLQQAHSLAASAISIANHRINDGSVENRMAAFEADQHKLENAIALLERVPAIPGAGKRQANQKILALENQTAVLAQLQAEETVTYHREQQAIESLAQAKQFAQQASTLVQSPPHSTEIWEQAQTIWQQGITALEAIPEHTTAFAEAQQQLITYRQAFQQVQQQRLAEDYALVKYEQADRLIYDVLQLTGSLDAIDKQHLTQLQQAQAKLDQAIQLLQSIPPETSLSGVAQHRVQIHLADYRQLLATIDALQNCNVALDQQGCRYYSSTHVSTFEEGL